MPSNSSTRGTPRQLEGPRVASNAPLAVRGTRATIAALERATVGSLAESTRAELRELRRRAIQSEDLREGLAAFAEKRAPRFTGR